MSQVEILAPAGSIESLYASLKMGADAVYTGTSRFGARAFAKNPSADELEEALAYAHLRGKKIYLTVNTLLNDRELEEELYPMIRPLYEAGLDACIVQDLGVLSFLHENFPDMPLHASTQMTLLSGEEAELFRPYGVTRIVPARELSLAEIKRMRAVTDMEIEIFVHGALCYCYSGQCRMSEFIGGRSGNHGMCAQPCRRFYQTPFGGGYVMNTKELCTISEIPALLDAGVDSFKIEGRMKSREYSAGTAFFYKKYVTICEEEGKERFYGLVADRESEFWKDCRELEELFNRGGFTKGFLVDGGGGMPDSRRPASRAGHRFEKSGIVCREKSGHFGTLVGTVKKNLGKTAVFLALAGLNDHDVLEFRAADGTSAYEYTLKYGAPAGELVTANIGNSGDRIFPGQEVYRRKNAKLLSEWSGRIQKADDKLPLRGTFSGEIGSPVVFQVSAGGVSARVEGDVLERASKRPVTQAEVRKNLDSLGNTDYYFQSLEIQMPEQAFLPMGGLKKLRRAAIRELETTDRTLRGPSLCQTTEGRRSAHAGRDEVFSTSCWVCVSTLPQLAALVPDGVGSTWREISVPEEEPLFCVLKLYELPPEDWGAAAERVRGTRFGLCFPPVLRGGKKAFFENLWKRYGGPLSGAALILINSFSAYLFAREHFPDAAWAFDENLYRENARAEGVYRDFRMIPAPKSSYGRRALMMTEGCVAATMGHCGINGGEGGASGMARSDAKDTAGGERSASGRNAAPRPCRNSRIPIEGPKGDRFIVRAYCDLCMNIVYTEKPVWDRRRGADRLDFTWETESEVREVIKEWNLSLRN